MTDVEARHTAANQSSGNCISDEGLDRVPAVDKIPIPVWIVAVAGAAERFAYYSLSAPLQNYIQNERGSSAVPGALGLGQQTATNLSNMFLLLQFVSPIPFAILSDMKFGRQKTLMISLGIYQCGSLILLITSLPVALSKGAGLPGLIAAMILIAIGVAGVKATLPPFLVDQYDRSDQLVIKIKGQKAIVADRGLTIQFITNMFFWLGNLAALSSLASTWIENKVDFWASYLLGFASLFITVILIYAWKRNLVNMDTQGSVLPLSLKALWCAVRHRFSLEAAMPEVQKERYGKVVPWNTKIIDDLRQTLTVSRVLLFSAPFYLAYIQIMNNLISQAGQMRLNGIPNDTMQVWNPFACIVLGPIIQKGVFPLLRRAGVPFGPIVRISAACFIMGAAMAYAAGIQHLIYSRGPCYDHPLTCPEATVVQGSSAVVVGNDISVWVQIPVWVILAVAEILGFATISEIAYEQAPKSMKSVVQAVTQLTAGLAAVIGIALSPITRDPTLVILYSVIAGLTVVAAVPFWFYFRSLDHKKQVQRDGD
ncbi:peptide transporter ptr2-like protein 2 [Colletotrichum musicola]|uniref:Peptide transporter ptr2-like protein 2 n=1 Tax=Colletotrichum musicola TaxID=2175873 RepID=A0A8H6NC99_9PEZI|nr:peptide transporter ptr2-like protein 2 [Colletotrichum musicola]